MPRYRPWRHDHADALSDGRYDGRYDAAGQLHDITATLAVLKSAYERRVRPPAACDRDSASPKKSSAKIMSNRRTLYTSQKIPVSSPSLASPHTFASRAPPKRKSYRVGPKLWANCRALIGIFSQSVGPSLAICRRQGHMRPLCAARVTQYVRCRWSLWRRSPTTIARTRSRQDPPPLMPRTPRGAQYQLGAAVMLECYAVF